MVEILKINDKYNRTTYDYLLEDSTDINSMPSNAEHGATAFCPKTGSAYMLGVDGIWYKL